MTDFDQTVAIKQLTDAVNGIKNELIDTRMQVEAIVERVEKKELKKQTSPLTLMWKWWTRNYRECIIAPGVFYVFLWMLATFFDINVLP